MINNTQYIEYLPIMADKNRNIFLNQEYIPEILMLFEKYDKYLLDDYYSNSNIERILELIEFINSLKGRFFAIVENAKSSKNFLGFVYLNNFRGNSTNIHSLEISTCFKPDYWGESVFNIAKDFIYKVKKEYKPQKIKAEIFKHNHRVVKLLSRLGFEHEATLKNETIVDGRPCDILVFVL